MNPGCPPAAETWTRNQGDGGPGEGQSALNASENSSCPEGLSKAAQKAPTKTGLFLSCCAGTVPADTGPVLAHSTSCLEGVGGKCLTPDPRGPRVSTQPREKQQTEKADVWPDRAKHALTHVPL